MSTEIINLSPVTFTTQKFKSDALNEATAKIAAIYSNAAKYADTKNREIAAILAKVAAEKSYVEDGFKSVAEYANKSFGIARQNAYSLAAAGKVYNDESAPAALKAFSPSKLAELVNVPAEVLEQSITAGDISVDTTQKDLRAYAKKVTPKSPEKSVVLDQYTATPCMANIPPALAISCKTPRLPEEWDTFFSEYIASATLDEPDNVEIVKLPKGYVDFDAKKATVNRKLYFTRFMSVVVEYYVYTAPKVLTATRKYTAAELRALLAAAEAEEAEEATEAGE